MDGNSRSSIPPEWRLIYRGKSVHLWALKIRIKLFVLRSECVQFASSLPSLNDLLRISKTFWCSHNFVVQVGLKHSGNFVVTELGTGRNICPWAAHTSISVLVMEVEHSSALALHKLLSSLMEVLCFHHGQHAQFVFPLWTSFTFDWLHVHTNEPTHILPTHYLLTPTWLWTGSRCKLTGHGCKYLSREKSFNGWATW